VAPVEEPLVGVWGKARGRRWVWNKAVEAEQFSFPIADVVSNCTHGFKISCIFLCCPSGPQTKGGRPSFASVESAPGSKIEKPCCFSAACECVHLCRQLTREFDTRRRRVVRSLWRR